MSGKKRIFISSVEKELAAERRAPHASIPHNPLIAEPLFLTRYVKKAGTGILDMIGLCEAAKLRPPQFRQEVGQFIQTLWRPTTAATVQVTAPVEYEHKAFPEHVLGAVADALGIPTSQVTAQVAAVLNTASREAKSRQDLHEAAGMKHREHFRKAYVDPLVTADWLRRTIPEKPTSRLQKYLIADTSTAWLAEYRKHGTDPGVVPAKSDKSDTVPVAAKGIQGNDRKR